MILYVRYSVRFLLWAMLAAGKTEWSLVAIGDVNKREWQGDRVQQLHRVSKKVPPSSCSNLDIHDPITII